jgi:hypothetical protein
VSYLMKLCTNNCRGFTKSLIDSCNYLADCSVRGRDVTSSVATVLPEICMDGLRKNGRKRLRNGVGLVVNKGLLNEFNSTHNASHTNSPGGIFA